VTKEREKVRVRKWKRVMWWEKQQKKPSQWRKQTCVYWYFVKRLFFAATPARLYSPMFFCSFDVDWDDWDANNSIVRSTHSSPFACRGEIRTNGSGVAQDPPPPSGNVSPWETSMSNVENYYKWKSYNVLMMLYRRWWNIVPTFVDQLGIFWSLKELERIVWEGIAS
jgi:hypothetical protein